MKVIPFGGTGMVGSGVLLECLDSPRVHDVLVIGRRGVGIAHPKLQELLHEDFLEFKGIQERISGRDAGFFCLGVSSIEGHTRSIIGSAEINEGAVNGGTG